MEIVFAHVFFLCVHTGSASCTTCPIHSDAGAGATQCECEAGFFSDEPSGECYSCPANSYCPGGTTIDGCPENSNSPAGSTEISHCQCKPGYSGPNGGTCSACTEGKYKMSPGPDTCIQCVSGKFSIVTAATAESTCSSCPENSDAPAGSAACICNAGFTGPNGGPCTACEAGKFKINIGSGACTNCGSGKFSTTVGATHRYHGWGSGTYP